MFLLAVTGVVVTVSVVVHGASVTTISTLYERSKAKPTRRSERESGAGGIFEGAARGTARDSPEELAEMMKNAMPRLILDVRPRFQYEKDQRLIPGAIRLRPDEVEEWVRDREDKHAPQSQVEGQRIVAYCT